MLFVGLFACLLLAACYAVVSGIFSVIRLFVPRFAMLPLPPIKEDEHDHKEVKRISLDFIVAERLRRQRELKKRMEEFLNPNAASENANEWDLESLKKQILQSKVVGRSFDPVDLWSIARHNERGSRLYLCTPVLPTKEGLRTAWAALPDRALKTSSDAAFRWLSVLPDAFVVPANAAARQKIRTESSKLRSEHATA